MALTNRRHRRRGRTVFRLHKPRWQDPFPWIPGTEPEKRVFEALVRSRIYFIFQGPLPELEDGKYVTLAAAAYKPDIVIPEYRVIIDPFSPFHHSLPEQVPSDQRKAAIYTALGYVFVHPWAYPDGVFVLDHDGPVVRGRYDGAFELLTAIPALHGAPVAKLTRKEDIVAKQTVGYRLGKNLGAGATSVAAANIRRTRPKPLTIRAGSRRRRR